MFASGTPCLHSLNEWRRPHAGRPAAHALRISEQWVSRKAGSRFLPGFRGCRCDLGQNGGLLRGLLPALDWPARMTLKDAMPTRTQMRRVEILVDSSMHLPEVGLTLAVRVADLTEPLVLTLQQHCTPDPAAAMPPGQP